MVVFRVLLVQMGGKLQIHLGTQEHIPTFSGSAIIQTYYRDLKFNLKR
jgi:hypothetical protein